MDEIAVRRIELQVIARIRMVANGLGSARCIYCNGLPLQATFFQPVGAATCIVICLQHIGVIAAIQWVQ